MRNFWLKILLGALGIFAIGMIGVTIVRKGVAKVHNVVESSDPITIPLGLIPFVLSGERLGNLDHVTLNRESPQRVSDVELEVNLTDSLLARGLSGCRLAANFGSDSTKKGINIQTREGMGDNTFYCAPGDSMPPDLVEFGVALLQPGDVEVPLLLPLDVVTDLQTLDFDHDSAAGDSIRVDVPDADSIKAEVARELEAAGVQVRRGDSARASARASARRFGDSVRAEARKRIAEDAAAE